jgi:tryptophan halogenase
MNPLRSIVIVGGGTAGWLAACYLQRTLGTDPVTAPRITLIESPEIGAIGVGEATVPTLRTTMQALGLPESALFAEAEATLKNGIRFVGWRQGGPADTDAYDHPFDVPIPFNGFPVSMHWLNLKQRGVALPSMAECSTVQTALFDNHKSPKLMHSPDYQAPLAYGYHLDAVRLAALLQQTAIGRGVQHVVGEVVRVDSGPEGIEAVRLADGSRHAGDFFIDCSGFRALLLHKALGVPWVSFDDWLPCDRAVAFPVAHESAQSPLRSYTTATAKAAGWTWEIDLQSRRGTGYVYASSHCSDDEAVETLRAHNAGREALAEPRLLRMRVGHHAKAWEKNCLALGLAGGFIEPLESTGIYLIEFALQLFVDHLPGVGGDESCRDAFNHTVSDLYDELRDFVVAHYALSMRRDTPFWRQCTDPARLPPSLTRLLRLWDSKLPSPTDLAKRLSLFGPANWLFVLAGMHHLPSRGIGQGPYLAEEISRKAIEHVRGIRELASKQSPTMRDYGQKQRAAYANRPTPG